jgi:putative flippase GtrA
MINKLFKAPPGGISVQLFRYILSGAAACAVDYSALVTLTQAFKLYYLTSAAIAFMLGSTVSYILNVTWVFDRRVFADRRMEAALFFSIGIAGLFLNHYCIQFFTETVKLHYLGSKVISTIVVFAVNFVARKYILFRADGQKSAAATG